MQVRIQVTLRMTNAFNIGTGALAGSPADKPLLRERRGFPYIPGSTLKGRLRHACEALARTLGEKVCDSPVAEWMCPDNAEVGIGQLCPACRLFGAPWHASPLRFSDLTLISPVKSGGEAKRVRTDLRHGVSLSRQRRVAEEDLLYTTEIFLPGGQVAFAGWITGDIPEQDLPLLLGGLASLYALGGRKTGGLGWMTVEAKLFTDSAEKPLRILKEGRWQDAETSP